MSSGSESIDVVEVVEQLYAYDSVASEIINTQLSNLLSVQSIITHIDVSDKFRYISAINSKPQDIIALEELRSRLCIGLETAGFTPKDTTHQYIRTIGLLTKRF